MEQIFKVVIIEDHVLFRQYLRDLLSERFPTISIDEAGNGKEALKKVVVSKPHFIFMDIALPDNNGIELTREIKSSHPDIQIVILTGLGAFCKKTAYESEADCYLEKGLTSLNDIFATVESCMASLE